MTGPKPIATQQAEAATGRAIGVGLALLVAVTVVPPWVGLVLGASVRLFRLAAGI